MTVRKSVSSNIHFCSVQICGSLIFFLVAANCKCEVTLNIKIIQGMCIIYETIKTEDV